MRSNTHFESVASVSVVPVPGADTALLADECGYLLKLLAIHVTVAVQIEHTKGYFEMATRC